MSWCAAGREFRGGTGYVCRRQPEIVGDPVSGETV